MRLALFLALMAMTACRVPYTADLADLTVWPDEMPPAGTSAEALDAWFHEEDYAPGPRVWQAEAELRRRPGAPLTYTLEKDRLWWLTRTQVVRDFCVTQKTIYYRVDGNGALDRAIQSHRSAC